jgi:hypothetical protein
MVAAGAMLPALLTLFGAPEALAWRIASAAIGVPILVQPDVSGAAPGSIRDTDAARDLD